MEVVPLRFAPAERTPAAHFRLYRQAAILLLLGQLQRRADLEELAGRLPFLAEYAEPLLEDLVSGGWNGLLGRIEASVAHWERGGATETPLGTVRQELGLEVRSLLLLMLSGLPDEDARFGSLYAQLLNFSSPVCRPSWPLFREFLGDAGDARSICWPLLETGLLAVLNREYPRPEWEFVVPPVLWDLLRGEPDPPLPPWCRRRQTAQVPALSDLLLPSELLGPLTQVPGLLQSGRAKTVVVRAPEGCEAAEVLGALARALGRGLMEVDAVELEQDQNRRLFGPLCTLSRSMPVITFDSGPGEVAKVPALPGYLGPVGVVLGLEGGLQGAATEETVTITLGVPEPELRLQQWQRVLGEHAPPDLPDIAADYALGTGHIRRAGALAVLQAAMHNRTEADRSDIRAGIRSVGNHLLENLALRLEPRGRWEDLAVSEQTLQQLLHLERRCRHRETLMKRIGPAYSYGKSSGVRALLTGPSGTGKTLAARILAAELRMEIYRVDLAAVINKYVGETEKNLSQVLSRAESLDVILLLDEGDSLLGKRADVRSANDRYANLQTNYLLQRLESYTGIVLVTTNLGQSIDPAFQRRMDAVVEFLPPSEEERLRIWRLHLPVENSVEEEFLRDVAARCTMTGGQIRNAALQAVLLALDAQRAVTARDVTEGVRMEYRKAGILCPLR